MSEYTFIPDLVPHADYPEDGILSLPIHEDKDTKVILFAFSKGQTLSEHTSSLPATLEVLEGSGTWILGEEKMEVSKGAWTFMKPGLMHSICADEPLKMLLVLIKSPKA